MALYSLWHYTHHTHYTHTTLHHTTQAAPILNKYRHKYRCFNDDIQGTGCVTLAGLIASAQQARYLVITPAAPPSPTSPSLCTCHTHHTLLTHYTPHLLYRRGRPLRTSLHLTTLHTYPTGGADPCGPLLPLRRCGQRGAGRVRADRRRHGGGWPHQGGGEGALRRVHLRGGTGQGRWQAR